ncbi:hypothetical protein COOONC_17258 [Cooperia oncophora]
MTVPQPPPLACGFAPATLPRQSTPLTAAPRFVTKPMVAVDSPSIVCLSQPPPVTPIRPAQTVQHSVLQQSSTAKHVVRSAFVHCSIVCPLSLEISYILNGKSCGW